MTCKRYPCVHFLTQSSILPLFLDFMRYFPAHTILKFCRLQKNGLGTFSKKPLIVESMASGPPPPEKAAGPAKPAAAAAPEKSSALCDFLNCKCRAGGQHQCPAVESKALFQDTAAYRVEKVPFGGDVEVCVTFACHSCA